MQYTKCFVECIDIVYQRWMRQAHEQRYLHTCLFFIYTTLYNKNYLVIAVSLSLSISQYDFQDTLSSSHIISTSYILSLKWYRNYRNAPPWFRAISCWQLDVSQLLRNAIVRLFFTILIALSSFAPTSTNHDFIANSFRKTWLLLLFFARNNRAASLRARFRDHYYWKRWERTRENLCFVNPTTNHWH